MDFSWRSFNASASLIEWPTSFVPVSDWFEMFRVCVSTYTMI